MSRKQNHLEIQLAYWKDLQNFLVFHLQKARRETIIEKRVYNMEKLLLIFIFCSPFMEMCQKACNVYGKIKFVDYKVKFVKYGEDLSIKYVNYVEKKGG